MKNGYDQFFANAKRAAKKPNLQKPSIQIKKKPSVSVAANSNQDSSSQKMVMQLREQIKNEKKMKLKKKKLPIQSLIFCFLGLGVAGWGYVNHERLDGWIKKVEVNFLGQAIAQEKPAANTPEKTTGNAEKPKEEVVAKKEFTEEELNHFARMNERKKELDMREEDLKQMEQELSAQKEEMDKRLAELENTRKDISGKLQDRVQVDDKRVDALVQVYTNMKPQQAAKVFETMDEDLAVEVIGRMKKKNAAEVMNLIKAEKAQMISEKLAGYRRAVASTPKTEPMKEKVDDKESKKEE
jgi:flagellar motility protein MotE (MotC chaperone)